MYEYKERSMPLAMLLLLIDSVYEGFRISKDRGLSLNDMVMLMLKPLTISVPGARTGPLAPSLSANHGANRLIQICSVD